MAKELEGVRTSWGSKLQVRSDSGAKELLDHLIASPVITRKRAVEILGRSDANSQLAIDKLVEAGILTKQGIGGRNRIWQAEDVLLALEHFAVNLRR